MNEDINLRIKFIQEVERHPFLYDHNHVLYNHRDKIESTWQKIGQMFGEESGDCKKKWRLIRCSYTRSLKAQAKNKYGFGLAKGYYMAPHLRFLDPFLKSRLCLDNNLSEEDEANEVGDESLGANEENHTSEVTLGSVKVEKVDGTVYEEDALGDDSSSQELLVERRRIRDEEECGTSSAAKRSKQDLVIRTQQTLSSSEMYLLSLTPYLDSMTEQQLLVFQKGVAELIETIKYGND